MACWAGTVEFAELMECAGVDWRLSERRHCGIGNIVVMDCSGNRIDAKDCAGAGVMVYQGSRRHGCLNCRGSWHRGRLNCRRSWHRGRLNCRGSRHHGGLNCRGSWHCG